MDLSAYERRILNAIPSEQRTEILARYAVAVARQLRAAVRTRHTHETVMQQNQASSKHQFQNDRELTHNIKS